jgi:acetyl-CoA C-acetyltransferase
MERAVIVSALRTPIGRFMGGLSTIPAPRLAAGLIKETVARAKLDVETVDEVILGNVLQAGIGQAPARQALIHGGIAPSVAAVTINKVCGSGMKSVMLAAQAIRLGDAHTILAGGMENMSLAPYLLPDARAGQRLGHGRMLDCLVNDGLWDCYNDFHMGNTAELVAKKYNVSREAQDEFAVGSHRKAQGRRPHDRGG